MKIVDAVVYGSYLKLMLNILIGILKTAHSFNLYHMKWQHKSQRHIRQNLMRLKLSAWLDTARGKSGNTFL